MSETITEYFTDSKIIKGDKHRQVRDGFYSG